MYIYIDYTVDLSTVISLNIATSSCIFVIIFGRHLGHMVDSGVMEMSQIKFIYPSESGKQTNFGTIACQQDST